MTEKKCMQTIEDAFSPNGLSAFLESLHVRGVRIWDLKQVSSGLTDFLPGVAFARGDTFDTSFLTLYQGLSEVEQRRIKEHYAMRVRDVPAGLKKKFARIFRS